MELATTVMPEYPTIMANDSKYSPHQRRAAIKRWMEKRARRHLTSQTKYRKMKDVAVSKARCRGGKFIKKSEREAMAKAEEARLEEEKMKMLLLPPAMETQASKEPWNGDMPDWQ